MRQANHVDGQDVAGANGVGDDAPFADAWEAEVDFVHDEGLPFGLLGYEGFLNRWAVSFNGYNGYFVVAPVDLFHDRQPSDLLDRLRSRWPGI